MRCFLYKQHHPVSPVLVRLVQWETHTEDQSLEGERSRLSPGFFLAELWLGSGCDLPPGSQVLLGHPALAGPSSPLFSLSM